MGLMSFFSWGWWKFWDWLFNVESKFVAGTLYDGVLADKARAGSRQFARARIRAPPRQYMRPPIRDAPV